MPSPLNKRLEKIEQLLADRINKPLATIWLDDGETREQACIRLGYDPSQVDRIHFIRWLTPEEGKTAPKPHWDEPQAGPPDASGSLHSETSTPSVTEIAPQPKQMDLEQMIAARERYERAIKRREAEIVAEKLAAASKAFAKSIA